MGKSWIAAGLAILTLVPAAAAAQGQARSLIALEAGEMAELFGTTFRAAEPTTALVTVSSELVTAAVIKGRLFEGGVEARAGEALVTPIDGRRTRRYGYDAARLVASLPPAMRAEAAAPLAAIAERQRRRAFWGLIEPVGVNAAAPVAPEVEAFRSAYLANPTVLALRREAAGDRGRLAELTLARFAGALAAADAAIVADLIDPAPFTAADPDPAIWRAARLAFARSLTGDAALTRAFAAGVRADAEGSSGEAGGAYRVGLVLRDRALFVTAVEPLS
jgi:hypothetical protein